MKSLETDRLILRRPGAGDAGVYRRLWTERDPRVPAHRRIDADGRPTREEIAADIRKEGQATRPGLWAVERKSERDLIGYCGLVFHGNGAPGEPELAYELLRSAHGMGYATEAGGAVVRYATEAGYERIWATVRAWNIASRGVLEKLGFRETGHVDADAVHGNSLLTIRECSAPTR